MAYQKKEKKQLIAHLPSDPVERKRVRGVIEEIVKSMLREQDEKDARKDIFDHEKEDNGYDPKMLKFYARMEYDVQYKAQKARKQLETQAEQLEELDILMGRQ